MLGNIFWLGHSSFKIKSQTGKIIYFDPWQLSDNEEKADLILISHSHYDHFSPEDIARIKKDDTAILAPQDCCGEIPGHIQTVKPGDQLESKGFKIEVVPAYNIDKEFHPRKNQWVGYVLEIDGRRIYHAGDTDLIPEMKNIRADIALLPVSGVYVMTASEAARAAQIIKSKVAIPMHYGEIVGSQSDAEEFARQTAGGTKILAKQ